VTECHYGTIELRIMPTCPECGGDWPLDNSHRRDGHCPGRPAGCTCQCEMQYHRAPHGCTGERQQPCPVRCVYLARPVNWATYQLDREPEERWQ